MGYHVHSHFIVPGGGISPNGKLWLPLGETISCRSEMWPKILRAQFRDALKKHPELFKQVPQKAWKTDWVVHIKSVGTEEKALQYLARYIFRVAISNKRISRFENGKVAFTPLDRV